jgi:hypothetical protein
MKYTFVFLYKSYYFLHILTLKRSVNWYTESVLLSNIIQISISPLSNALCWFCHDTAHLLRKETILKLYDKQNKLKYLRIIYFNTFTNRKMVYHFTFEQTNWSVKYKYLCLFKVTLCPSNGICWANRWKFTFCHTYFQFYNKFQMNNK